MILGKWKEDDTKIIYKAHLKKKKLQPQKPKKLRLEKCIEETRLSGNLEDSL